MLPNGLKEILNHATWLRLGDKINKFPAFGLKEFIGETSFHKVLNFLFLRDAEVGSALPYLEGRKDMVIILYSKNKHNMPAVRRAFVSLIAAGLELPVVCSVAYESQEEDKTMLYAATDIGGLLTDGLGEGIMMGLQNKELSA